MNKLTLFIVTTIVVGNVTLAQAATYSPAGINRPLAEEGWNGTFTLNKFDARLGTLTNIEFDFTQYFEGISQTENKNSYKQDISLQLQATLSLTDQYGTTVDSASQTYNYLFHAQPYDHKKDFDGVSGITYDTKVVTLPQVLTTSDPYYLALYSAPTGGTFSFTGLETDTSNFSGTGNTAIEFTTLSGGSANLIYTYTAAVPEPETCAMLLAGVSLLGFLSRVHKPA